MVQSVGKMPICVTAFVALMPLVLTTQVLYTLAFYDMNNI
jgi:hypothetical protein